MFGMSKLALGAGAASLVVILGLSWYSVQATNRAATAEARTETAQRAAERAQERLREVTRVDVSQEAERRSTGDSVRSATGAVQEQERQDAENPEARCVLWSTPELDRVWKHAINEANRSITDTR